MAELAGDGKTDESSPITSEHVSEDGGSDNSQAGVRRIEAISQTWSKPALIVAYVRSAWFSFSLFAIQRLPAYNSLQK